MKEEFIVSKSNYFIANSSYDLSLEEQRIILTLASLVQPQDEELKIYSFQISEFIKMLGIKDQTKYSSLPILTKGLMKKVFEIKEGSKLRQFAWLSYAEHDLGQGIISLGFSPFLKPYLLQLKEYFTKYKLSNILKMKSKYSPRLYELLKANQYNKRGFEIKVEELRRLFKAKDIYKAYKDFKVRVIVKAVEEVNSYTDINVKFEEVKKGRKVDSLKFFIFENKKLEEPKKIKDKKIVKSASEKKVEKVEKDLEESKQRIDKVYQENQKQYALYLAMEEDKREEIDKLAEKYYIELIGAKRLGSVTRKAFEKAKKTYIIKAMDIKSEKKNESK